MVDNIPGAVYRTGADGWTVEYISEPIRELSGRGPDYFTSFGSEALASVAHSDDLPTSYEKISRSMATGVPYEHEYRIIHTDGSIRWVNEIAHAVRGSDGVFLWLDGVIFDVTEKKAADEQLRRSEASLVNAQRIAGLGSWEWDLNADTLWWAEGTYPLFGFDPDVTSPNYDLFLHHVHPDDRAAMDGAVESALATGKSYTLDFRFTRPDGEERIFQDSAEPALDSKGKATALLGSVLDITERKQAEERLRRSEASLANAQRIAHVGSWEWDVPGARLYWSDEVFRIFGQNPETFDLALEDYYAAVHPSDREWLRVAVEKGIQSGEPFSSDHRIVRPDGEVRVIHEESEVTRVEDGATAWVSGTIQDVTEQRRAEERLRTSEASLANAQRIAHIGSWDWDLVKNEALWSDEVHRIAGLDPSGEPLTDEIVRSMVHPDDLARLEAQEGRAMERREPYTTNYRMIRPDGEVRTVHETCEPSFNDAGEVVRLSGTVQDITEQRHAEEELRRSEASLANAQRIARIGNWDWDPATDKWRWSDEIFRMLGRERKNYEIGLDNFYAAVHPDDVESLKAAVDESVRQGAGYHLDFRVVRPDGDVTVVSEQVEVVRDDAGRIVRISGIDQDITERRRAEQELRETLERLDLVTNATVDCIYDWDITSDGLWHSFQLEELLGYEPKEVRNQLGAWLSHVHPDDVETLNDALDHHFESRVPFELEYRARTRDGRFVWLQDRGQAVWDEAGVAVRMVGSLHDVTERKLAEERLRASEEQLRVITDNIPMLIGYIDRDERYRFANKAQEAWFGMPVEDIIGKPLREVLGEASYREVKPKVDRVLMGDRVDSEDVYERPGGPRVVQSTRIPHISEDGSVLGYFIVVEDITERKRVVEALRASEEQLRVITDNVPAVIVYVDKDERFRFANRAQSEWLGYPAVKTIGKTMREVLGETHYASVKPEIDKVLSGQVSNQELAVEHPVKGKVMLNNTRIPHIAEDGSVLGYFAVVEDITERKHSEQALRDNEAQLRLVTDNVPAMIIYVDRGGTIQFVNRAREMWSEQPAGELVGRTVREVVASETYEANRAQIDDVLRGNPNSGEHAVEHPRFGHRVLETTRVPNFNDRGEVVGYLAVVEDITERKLLEEELRHTQKMEAVGQLAGGISHEVNNMLTPIVGLTEMTLHNLPEDSKSRPNLEMVLTASHRVEELVKRILAFSRADTEEMVEFDLSDVVAETIPLLKASVPSTIQIEAEVEDGIGPVFGNPTAVQQVLMNLATNAAYAMEPEGGHFTVALDRASKREGSRLRRLLGAGDGIARLTIQDTGCGMSEEVLERMFEPFFTTREVGSGTGLGLSVVHGIVTKLGGRIEVESVKDKGTKFVIHIPLVGKSGGASATARR
jgi:PAS domain S-box-containing protein